MRKFDAWTRLVAVLLVVATVTGCNKSSETSGGGAAPGASTADTIKVGEFASLTGKEASFGQMSHHGTELAIDELNSQGGVLGKKLELLTEDNQSKQGESKTIARKRSAIPPPSEPTPGAALFLGRPFGFPEVPFLN